MTQYWNRYYDEHPFTHKIEADHPTEQTIRKGIKEMDKATDICEKSRRCDAVNTIAHNKYLECLSSGNTKLTGYKEYCKERSIFIDEKCSALFEKCKEQRAKLIEEESYLMKLY